jgi:hypothetical protein
MKKASTNPNVKRLMKRIKQLNARQEEDERRNINVRVIKRVNARLAAARMRRNKAPLKMENKTISISRSELLESLRMGHSLDVLRAKKIADLTRGSTRPERQIIEDREKEKSRERQIELKQRERQHQR